MHRIALSPRLAHVFLTLTARRDDVLTNAGDLGFVLHKHPDKAQSFSVSAGTAHVLWPESGVERAQVALLLEVDPVALVRGRGRRDDPFALAQYVNDRPYVAGSLLAVALSRVFSTAMSGRCVTRPELAEALLSLEIRIPALAASGGETLVRRLFEPLGWDVVTAPIPLDPTVPDWGDSRYVDLTLSGRARVADALTQLYVLMPVLDDGKHYWVSDDEVEKLLRAGTTWLGGHPERELITGRFLAHRRELVGSAIARLAEIDEVAAADLDNAVPAEDASAATVDSGGVADDAAPAVANADAHIDAHTDTDADADEPRVTLAELRKGAVLTALRSERAGSVVDLGCGQGALLRELIADPVFTRVLGVDVSHRALEVAAKRLHLDRMPDSQRARLELIQSSVTYRDDRLRGYDAVVLMEVIEHVDPPRLVALERSVFAHARPISVIVTTPNVEFNVRYETLPAGTLRHRDHRFEWTRAEFQAWADRVADEFDYTARFLPVGEVDPELGGSTQMAIFRRSA